MFGVARFKRAFVRPGPGINLALTKLLKFYLHIMVPMRPALAAIHSLLDEAPTLSKIQSGSKIVEIYIRYLTEAAKQLLIWWIIMSREIFLLLEVVLRSGTVLM